MAAPLVLLIEHDPQLAETLELVLEQEGYKTLWARDGAQALELCRTLKPNTPDLGVVELMTPGLSGLEFLIEYKGAAFPVVALGSEALLLHEALDQGAHAVLAKPFHVESLLSLLSAWQSRTLTPVLLPQVPVLQPTPGVLQPESVIPDERWLDQVAGLFRCDVAALELSLGTEVLVLGAGGGDAMKLRHRRESWRTSLAYSVIRSGEPLWISDLAHGSPYRHSRWNTDYAMKGVWIEPCLLPDLSVPAVLSLASRQSQFFSHLDASLLRHLAHVVFRDALESRPPRASGFRWGEFVVLSELLVQRASARGIEITFTAIPGTQVSEDELQFLTPGVASFCSVSGEHAFSVHLGLSIPALRELLPPFVQADAQLYDGRSWLGGVRARLAAIRQSIDVGKDFRTIRSA